MLFIYWIEDREPFSKQIDLLRGRMHRRGDTLCTSVFTLGELLVAPERTNDQVLRVAINNFFESREIELIPFDRQTAARFAKIRSSCKVKAADAIHLACASEAGTDLFLTNDHQIRKLVIPGIQFIDGIDTGALGPLVLE